MSDKTEEPTPKRLRKAREEGDSGQSAFAAQALSFLVAVVLVPSAALALFSRTRELLLSSIARAADATPGAPDPTGVAWTVVAIVTPLLLAAGLTAGAAQLVQTGGFVATKKLTPKLDHLNPISGFKNLFSTARLFAVLRAFLGGGAVAYLAYRGLREHAADIARLSGRLGYVGRVSGEVAYRMCRDAALLGLAIGAADLVVVRRGWMKRLRMSKDEVKREYKESEGDPQTKAARERARHEMLSAAAVRNVKNATVVVVNPTHIACALRYDEEEGDEAPVVLAVGEGDLARQIVQAAHAYGVPVLQDVPLARALVELQPGDQIPEELYEAVAEILREAWSAPG